MFSLSLLFLLCISRIAVNVRGITPCCGPKQWTSEVAQVVGEFNLLKDYYRLSEVDNTFYYDYQTKKIASVQTVTNETSGNHTVVHMKQILDYNLMKKWVIHGENCIQTNLTENMPSPCLPESAMHLSTQTLINELVDVWLTEYKSGTRVQSTVTQKNCIPVTTSKLTGKPDYIMTVSLYQNVTAMTIDPSVFHLPSSCQKNTNHNEDFVISAIPWM